MVVEKEKPRNLNRYIVDLETHVGELDTLAEALRRIDNQLRRQIDSRVPQEDTNDEKRAGIDSFESAVCHITGQISVMKTIIGSISESVEGSGVSGGPQG